MITTSVLDDFQRANEDPLSQGGNWSAVPTGNGAIGLFAFSIIDTCALVSNQAQEVNRVSGSHRTSDFPVGDAEVWVTAGETSVGASEEAGLSLHLHDADTVNVDGYIGEVIINAIGNATWRVVRVDNGSETSLNPLPGPGFFNSDQLLFRRVGSDLELWLNRVNAVHAPNFGWINVNTVTDTNYSGGAAGIVLGTDDLTYTDFGGGATVEFVPQIMRYV